MARTIKDLMQYSQEAECRPVGTHVTRRTGVGFERGQKEDLLGLLFVLFHRHSCLLVACLLLELSSGGLKAHTCEHGTRRMAALNPHNRMFGHTETGLYPITRF